MKTPFLSIIIASIVVATVASIALFFNPGHQSTCTFCPAQYSSNQPLQIRNVTTSPDRLTIGKAFLIYANVYNPNPYSIYIKSGCVSSLSAVFDQHVKVSNPALVSCLAITRQEIPSLQEARIVGPSMGIVYNATKVGTTNTTITVMYEDQGKTQNVTVSKQFTIDYPASQPSSLSKELQGVCSGGPGMCLAQIRLDCTRPIGKQMAQIDKSIDVKKAISLAYTSPEFIAKVKQYGTVSYNSFFNDWIAGDPCNTLWKGVEVVFSATDKNGFARNIQVSEDVNLTKVLKVTEYQSGFS